MRLAIASLIVAVVSSIGIARAEVHAHAAGKVEIDLPGTWKVTKDKKLGLLVGESKTKAVVLMFWVVDKSDAKEAIALLDKALEGKVTNVAWPNKPQAANINGIKGIKNVGTATIEGKPAFVMVAVLGPTPSRKGVIVFGAIDQSKLAEHKAELENVFASLKPTK